MSYDVQLVQLIDRRLARIQFDGDTALWTLRKLRKRAVCCVSERVMEPGEEAFGPVGNQLYRSKRIEPTLVWGTAENMNTNQTNTNKKETES